MYFYCFAVLLSTVSAVKLLNVHVLELFANYMTILTASMGHQLNSAGRRSERCLIACSTGMDSYHVLAKFVALNNIETNSGHVQKWWATFRLHHIASICLWGEVNDVENNPGPAVFDNTNPTTSVSAGHKTGNCQNHTLVNVTKQCTLVPKSDLLILWTKRESQISVLRQR